MRIKKRQQHHKKKRNWNRGTLMMADRRRLAKVVYSNLLARAEIASWPAAR